MSTAKSFDTYLQADGPAALVIREPLMPVEGEHGVLFPATFAGGDGFPGGYNIDGDPQGKNSCLVDSVGSQANRIEPLFESEPYAQLVPQIVIKAGEKNINLLQAGHRAGDALVRCSELQEELQQAFREVLRGNSEAMAKIAPTSLIFGVWDSRDTQAKLPRLVSSTIRAKDVRQLRRSAQFNPATDFVRDGLLDEPLDKAAKDAYAVRGFIHVPATGTHGGVIAEGGVERTATLSLAALKLLSAKDPEQTLKLRRYVLGLSLVAFTAHTADYLRQGCQLVLNPDKEREFSEVYPNGKRTPCTLTHEAALKFAQAAAKEFGVGESRTVDFDKERAKRDVSGEAGAKGKKKGKKSEAAGA
ncbi:type I-G CRISPR-associated RAMP protein Csb1/Cas7g [Planctomicrobium sp. SH527]|uniref:type I-G CRISPR-associated RAMP protein Csb1/Cas7g n=1 Tax=Planctomicrobium sp. SH527 TaxID=3448123 RepID=UPI003F5C63AE